MHGVHALLHHVCAASSRRRAVSSFESGFPVGSPSVRSPSTHQYVESRALVEWEDLGQEHQQAGDKLRLARAREARQHAVAQAQHRHLALAQLPAAGVCSGGV